MHKKITAAFLITSLSLQAMEQNSSNSSSSSSSAISRQLFDKFLTKNKYHEKWDTFLEQEKNNERWNILLAHPLGRMQFVFAISDHFSEQRRKAFHRIEHLTSLNIKYDAWIEGPALSADGSCFATGDVNGVTRIINAESGDTLRTIKHPDVIDSIALSADGSRCVTACRNGIVRIIDAKKKARVIKNLCGIESIALSADGSRLAVLHDDRAVAMIDAQSKATMWTIENPHWYSLFALSADGSRLALYRGGSIDIVDAQRGTIMRTFGDMHEIDALALNADGSLCAMSKRGFEPGVVCIIHTDSGAPTYAHRYSESIRRMALNADCSRLAVACSDRIARIINTESGEVAHTITINNWIEAIALSDDGSRLAMRYGLREAAIFDCKKIQDIVNQLSLAQCDLLESFACAARGGKYISANQSDWELWLSLQKILPARAIEKLEPYIRKDGEQYNHTEHSAHEPAKKKRCIKK